MPHPQAGRLRARERFSLEAGWARPARPQLASMNKAIYRACAYCTVYATIFCLKAHTHTLLQSLIDIYIYIHIHIHIYIYISISIYLHICNCTFTYPISCTRLWKRHFQPRHLGRSFMDRWKSRLVQCIHSTYPLVMTNVAMENHQFFSWENPLLVFL